MTMLEHDRLAVLERVGPQSGTARSGLEFSLFDEPSEHQPSLYKDWLKRVFDVTAIMLAAPIVLMLVGFLALVIACVGGSPFYKQPRIGRGGRTYMMWKLRSMTKDADAMLEAHLNSDPAARDEWDTTQKLKNDPRVTRLGRLLRKSSMDELPQLWNVLKGDMSLVGPRPMMVDQRPLYPGLAYYHLRPGITGIWQVSERNDSSFADRAKFDTKYFEELSFLTDLRLLAATVKVVVHGTGH